MSYESYERYQLRRNRALFRIKRLRELDAPRVIVRNEQIFMWGLRQQRYNNQYVMNSPMVNIPGWQENYQKFVLIHEAEGTMQ